MQFTELNLHDQLIEAIDYMGFQTATPIQEESIPIILKNRDIIACSQTGTGKTAAFVLPILNKLVGVKTNHTDTVIIVPTRELAIQIEQQIQGLGYFISVDSKAIYGGGSGKDFDLERNALKNGTEIIVATPGKLLSHLRLGYVNFKHVKHLVLDEADKMLDMGFVDDINEIISHISPKRQTIMFSATMPKGIVHLANKILDNPARISMSMSKPAEGVAQVVYLAYDEQKVGIINSVLAQHPDFDSIIIFTSTKNNVSDIVQKLRKSGYKAHGISSNLDQVKREEVLQKFRARQLRILVATDVMSRGIDIKEINMVINYDCPHDAEDYVHRVGRTARANTKGEAVTLVNPKDMYRLSKIERLIDAEITKLQPPAELGEGPEWKESKPPRPKNKKPFYKKKKPIKKKDI